LGISYISNDTGNEICLAVNDIIENWALLEKIQRIVFDTTAYNFGRLNGACDLLEQKLARNILFLTCKHHIFEIILQVGFIEAKKIVPSSGLNLLNFKRFLIIGKILIKTNIQCGQRIL